MVIKIITIINTEKKPDIQVIKSLYLAKQTNKNKIDEPQIKETDLVSFQLFGVVQRKLTRVGFEPTTSKIIASLHPGQNGYLWGQRWFL